MSGPELLRDSLSRSAAAVPDQAAIIAEDGVCTYRELHGSATRLAGYLQAQGLAPGDRVVVYLDNGWPCAAAIYGIMMAGGVFVVVNPQTKAEKLHFLLADSGAVGLITDQHLSNQYEAATKGLADLRFVLSGGDGLARLAVPVVGELRRVMREAPPLRKPVAVEQDDLAALIYTSGSTGDPKGVMQTNRSMVFSARTISGYLDLRPDDRILLVLPMAFDYGLYQLLMSVRSGAVLVVERSFAFTGRVYQAMRAHRVSVLPGVPTVFAALSASRRKSALVFPDVRLVTNTAAVLQPELLPDLMALFPNARIFKMYGLTECKRVSYLDPALLADHPTSVGHAMPGTEVSLHTPGGEPVGPGEPGILHVRGPHVMLGYWKRPEATAMMLRDGSHPGERVLVAQDWFTQDKNGLLYFVRRNDDIIKSRGEKVSPIEVERVLCRLPGILQAAVVGIPDTVLGQRIRAFVVAAADAELTGLAVQRYCAERLENFMVPQEVFFLPELPRSANNKVDRQQLLDWSV